MREQDYAMMPGQMTVEFNFPDKKVSVKELAPGTIIEYGGQLYYLLCGFPGSNGVDGINWYWVDLKLKRVIKPLGAFVTPYNTTLTVEGAGRE